MFFYSKKEEEVVTFVCNLVDLSKKWLETGLKKICSILGKIHAIIMYY